MTSSTADELVVISYLKTVLEAQISADLLVVNDPVQYALLSEIEKRKTSTFAKTQVVLGDAQFDLIDSEDSSTPVILPEIDFRNATTNSVQGSRVYGENRFNFAVMVARENRNYTTYTQEVIDVVNRIEEVFKAQTQKRILIGNIAFALFVWNKIKVSGAVVPIVTNVNNYDYSVT